MSFTQYYILLIIMAFTHLLRSSKIFRNISACDIFYQPPPVYQEIIPEIFAKFLKKKKIPFLLWNHRILINVVYKKGTISYKFGKTWVK